jgi:transcriptional activator of cad operon
VGESQLTGSVFRIGDLRVDAALDEIQKDGLTLKLEPRIMRLLVCLAERAGQVVSVEELLELVWKDVVVSPDSVYRAVASLRRTIGDDVKEPTYIANVMRRGYRLVATVSTWTEFPEAPAGTAPVVAESAEPTPRISSRASLWAGSALSAAVALGTSYVAVHHGWFAKHESTTSRSAPAVKPLATSVAVLPFLDMSEQKDEEFFADGMSEELIDRLAKVPELKVPARTSSFYFKGDWIEDQREGHGTIVHAQLKTQGKLRVKALYEPMGENDEPPYPLHGPWG